MIAPILVATLSCMAAQIAEPAQFRRVMKGLHENYRDISFVYEGRTEFVGPERLLEGKPVEILNSTFQGTYAYRNDGAAVLDLYADSMRPNAATIRTGFALLGDRYEELQHVPDAWRKPHVTSTTGASGTLDMPNSAHRFLYFWFFEQLNEHNFEIQDQAFEVMDGFRCLKVTMNLTPSHPPSRARLARLWIDLERGGQARKIERYVGKDLYLRTRVLRLERLKSSSGSGFWLPTSSVTETFLWENDNAAWAGRSLIRRRLSRSPTLRATTPLG